MKYTALIICFFVLSCDAPLAENNYLETNSNWKQRKINDINLDSLTSGSTYLSVYSHIYSNTEHEDISLGATVSIKNPNRFDTIFVTSAEYFDTHGKSLRNYANSPVYVSPMETVEIIINRLDKEGGSGANFIFDWKKKSTSYEPFFECVMISADASRGYSFTTQGYTLE
jgi:hypothetical protein